MVGFIGFLEFQKVKVSFNLWFEVEAVINEMTVIWNKILFLYLGHGLWRVHPAASFKGKGTGDSTLNQLVFFFDSNCLLVNFILIYKCSSSFLKGDVRYFIAAILLSE